MTEEKYYTISSDPKRLDGADNYGNVTDSVYLEGETDSVLWKHAPSTEVTKGLKVYGLIETLPTRAGGTYRKFSKKQLPEDMTSSPSDDGSTSSPKAPQGQSNGGDGARQGMSINNAAKYVIESAVKDSITLDPKELAEEIQRYALEIYKIDLTITVNDFEDLD